MGKYRLCKTCPSSRRPPGGSQRGWKGQNLSQRGESLTFYLRVVSSRAVELLSLLRHT